MDNGRLERMKAKIIKFDETRNPHVLVGFRQLDMNLDITRKKESQLRKYFHKIGL